MAIIAQEWGHKTSLLFIFFTLESYHFFLCPSYATFAFARHKLSFLEFFYTFFFRLFFIFAHTCKVFGEYCAVIKILKRYCAIFHTSREWLLNFSSGFLTSSSYPYCSVRGFSRLWLAWSHFAYVDSISVWAVESTQVSRLSWLESCSLSLSLSVFFTHTHTHF